MPTPKKCIQAAVLPSATPKPHGTKLAIAVSVLRECVTSAAGSERAVLPKPRVSV